MHGYELSKRLNTMLGAFRAFSYGSLYPCLKQMLAVGHASADGEPTGSRSRIVYRLTAEGKEHLQDLLGEAGPSSWEDENFGVHFAFFSQTDAAVRMRAVSLRLSEYRRKRDYRNSAEPKGDEQLAAIDATRRYSGG